MPEASAELLDILRTLERHYGDMQDTEFTVEEGRLYMLQTRAAKRPAQAAVRFAVDAVAEGLLTRERALLTIDASTLDALLLPTFDAGVEYTVVATGVAASPGAASGEIVLSADDAKRRAGDGVDVILVRPFTEADDVAGFHAAKGILTSEGGKASHAALVARGMGRPAVCGAAAVEVELAARVVRIGERELRPARDGRPGDRIAINGSTGEITLDDVPLSAPGMTDAFRTVLDWADGLRRLGVRANADTPHDAERARELGAEGIGLCRTEHMFMAAERTPKVRAMIMAADTAERETALEALVPLQRGDFEGLFEAMTGRPVTIRLLDPPLHEFLPPLADLERQLARLRGTDDPEVEEVKRTLERVRALQETNPMLGTRGCRLGILYPEIYDMQARAIAEAAAAVRDRTGEAPHLEVMIPLVAYEREIALLHPRVAGIISAAGLEEGRDFVVGTMIELPRACLLADRIATHADFFSFGTNDLTQTTLGFSRDDIEASFLGRYETEGIVDRSPFETIDTPGVGELLKMGAWLGRTAKPGLKLGVCGEHGGDPGVDRLLPRRGARLRVLLAVPRARGPRRRRAGRDPRGGRRLRRRPPGPPAPHRRAGGPAAWQNRGCPVSAAVRPHPTGPVAEAFAAGVRAREAEALAPAATPCYPAARARPEPDCGLRTPFQRDRDRIVHCKAFRRLKHKTQVFVAPEGDHYRTRLTHTLEVTQVSRTVARALRLNEDLVEAIGPRPRPRPPALRPHRRGRARRLPRRALRSRLPPLRALPAGGRRARARRRGAQPHRAGARRDRSATPAAPSARARLEGRIVRLVDRIAYINHDIDDALRAGVIAEADLPAEPIAVLGDTGSAPDRRARPRPRRALRARRGHRAGRGVGRRDGRAAHLHVRARLPRPGGAPRARQDRDGRAHAVRALLRAAGPVPLSASVPDADDAQRVTDYIAGMTDRFCIRAFEDARGAARLRAVTRYTDDSRERVRDAVDMVALVSTRTELRRAGGELLLRPLPLPRRAHAVLSRPAAGEALPLLRLRGVGRPVRLRHGDSRGSTSPPRWSRWPTASASSSRSSTRIPRRPPRRRRRERLHELLDRATRYYQRVLWDADEAAGARAYLAERGLTEETLAAFRVGYAPSAWDRMLVASRRAGFTEEELLAAGLAQRLPEAGGGPSTTASASGSCSRSPTRAAGSSASARARCATTSGRSTSTRARARSTTRASQLFGIDLARPNAAREGSVVLVEGYTDVLACTRPGWRTRSGSWGRR